MNAERWRAIEQVYHAALEHQPAERAGFLQQACPDESLRAEIESLLGCEAEAADFLEMPALEVTAEALAEGRTRSMLGRRLGHYEITAFIGAGGMGEVYRARDARIGRDVAIKVMPPGLGSDPERARRFEQEARAAAAMSHANILSIFDVGVQDGAPYVVYELLEGGTLRGALRKGALPQRKALDYACQIARGLAAAHEKGVAHCDLKPENLFITRDGRVRILDFGLARLTRPPAPADDEPPKKSPSESAVAAGTPGYMAPEQLRGEPVDHRSDLFNLGAILYEMLTGERPFRGATPAEAQSAILNHDPIEALETGRLDPAVTRLLRRCLEKDPNERMQSALDLAFQIEGLLLPREKAAVPDRRIAAALALATVLLAGLSFLHFREPAPHAEVSRMSIVLPEKSRALSVAMSPDGRAVAMILVKDGKQQIWVRPLEALEPLALAGTDGAADPFWSPDSRHIAFFADARLKKIERGGGPVQTLCDALAARGGSWNRSGDILLGALGGVERVSAAGGPVTEVPKDAPGAQLYPVFLPDGRHYLATRGAEDSAGGGVWLNSIDGSHSRRILPDVSNVQVVEPPPGSNVGQILFVRAGALMSLPFDMQRLEPAAAASPVARGIVAGIAPYWLASSSSRGALAYVSGERAAWQYVWRDPSGRKLGVAGDAGSVVQLSADGKRLAGDRDGDTWVFSLVTGAAMPLTFGRNNINPAWSPDGRYIAYSKVGVGLCRKPADGAGAEEVLVRSRILAAPKSWSPDGRFILYARIDPATAADLFAVSVEPGSQPFPVVQSPANEDQGQFSPDGHWIAYTSNETGLSEIYVIPFPPSPTGGKWLVSRSGGVQPRWRRDGKRLFYISPDNRMMAVAVDTRSAFHAASPRPLFQTEMVDTGIRTGPQSWDLTPDGNRFLIISERERETPSVIVVVNSRTVPE